MKRLLPLVLVFTGVAQANTEVFRRIGPDGEVYFSDSPGPGAESVIISPAQTTRLPAVAPRTVDVESSADVKEVAIPAYTDFSVVKPSPDQGVRANDGSVTIYLSLRPALMPGHTIELKVDGEDGEKIRSGDTLNFNLSEMSRGRHSVAARVVDENGQELITTDPVGFYVLRAALRPRARAQ